MKNVLSIKKTPKKRVAKSSVKKSASSIRSSVGSTVYPTLEEEMFEFIGHEGPFVVDTGLHAHSMGSDGNDELVLGVGPRGIVTKRNVMEFLVKFDKMRANKKFEGRSYFYEGLRHDGDKNYSIRWGS
jgi:hypothetical protein